MSFKLTILGCNSAIPTVNNNPTAQLLNANDHFFLIDCAEGTQVQIRRNKIKFQKISHIFISHLHGDHYFGLIGLLTTMHLLGREKELHIFSDPKLKMIVDAQLSVSDTDLCYPLFFHPLNSDVNEVLFEDSKIKVSTFPLDHGIRCNGFLFEEKLPSRRIISEKIAELNIPIEKLKELKHGNDYINDAGEIIKNSSVTKCNRDPFSYAFCSDTKYNESIIDNIKGVKLLYHEATFMEDMRDRAYATNHSTTIDAGMIAKKADVNTLLIGHFSQRYRDKSILLNETKSVFQNTIVANQGETINFSDL